MNIQKDYNLYTVFLKMCEVKNYSKVAELLNYNSARTIKEKMNTLSAQVGVDELFRGHARGAEPTSEALELLKQIKPHIEALDFAGRDFQEFNSESKALIRMIATSSISILMSKYFKEYKEKFPKVEIEIYNQADSDNYDLLAQNKVDFVIEQDYICKRHGLTTINLFESNLILIVSKSFKKNFNLKPRISIDKLAKLPIIGYYKDIQKCISNYNLTSPAFLKTATLDPVYSIVKEGTGIGLYYNELLQHQGRGKDISVLKPKNFTLPSVTISCGIRGNLTKAAQSFVDGLVVYFLNFHNQVVDNA